MKFDNYDDVLKFLNERIGFSQKITFQGKVGLLRMRYFMKLLGNPQNKVRSIHIAGTSGKGSVAYLLSILLKASGFRVGLHVSPFVKDLRERFQINNGFVSKKKVVLYFQEIYPSIQKCADSPYGLPTYFEILTALAFLIFWKEKVDFAILETGLGGTFDGTNVIDFQKKLAIITKIGKDHTEVLGNTLEKIAWQKAGIIQKRNNVLILSGKSVTNKVFQKKSKAQKASFEFFDTKAHIRNVKVSLEKTSFVFSSHDKDWHLSLKLLGFYQAENAGLALRAWQKLGKMYTFACKYEKAKMSLSHVYFPGRFEIIRNGSKIFVIDVAHNVQKMSNFIASLKSLFPGRKFHFIVAFKRKKDYALMMKTLLPVANYITLTSFFSKKQDMLYQSVDPKILALYLKKKNFSAFSIEENHEKLFSHSKRNAHIISVITGSLYLVSELLPLLQRRPKM